jgi:hypothetical protein
VIDLPERPVDQPIVVGRAGDAQVQIPSMLVAPRQCVLFVHDGQWAIQDVGGGAGTYVNGESLNDTRYLSFGDVIALGQGSAAPTIEVDPLGVARQAEAYAGDAASVAGSGVRPPQPGERTGQWLGADAPPQPQPNEDASWGEVATAAGESRGAQGYYVPHRRISQGTIIAGVVALVVLAVVGVLLVVSNSRDTVRHVPAPNVPKGKANNIFDQTENERLRQAQGKGAKAGKWSPSQDPSRVDSAHAVPRDDTKIRDTAKTRDPDDDPRRSDGPPRDAALAELEELDRTDGVSNPAMAIQRYEQYRRDHPATPLAKDLDQLVERAVDRLWWKRVEELLEARDRHQEAIDKINTDLAQSKDASAEFLKTLDEQRKQETERKQKCVELLAEMDYTAAQAPPMADGPKMARLRAARNADRFGDFRSRVVARAKMSGSVPWAPPP